MRGVWASMNVMTLDEDSWTYLQEQLALIFASWGWKCHVVRIWKRSCISCRGSLLSKDYKAKTLILCRRCWFMCLYCSLNTRLRNRMKHLSGRYRVAGGLWQPRGPCPWWDPRAVIWGFRGLPPAGGSIFLFYGMWSLCPASPRHWETENWKQELPTYFLRSTFSE